MSNQTQNFKLFELLKSGEPVKVTTIAEVLDVELKSVPVYIHGLKKLNADIASIREGRKVAAYQLNNSKDMNVQPNKTTLFVKKPVAVKADDDEEEVEDVVSTLSDKDIEDIHSSLRVEVAKNLAD